MGSTLKGNNLLLVGHILPSELTRIKNGRKNENIRVVSPECKPVQLKSIMSPEDRKCCQMNTYHQCKN